jgi:hypothetical protein
MHAELGDRHGFRQIVLAGIVEEIPSAHRFPTPLILGPSSRFVHASNVVGKPDIPVHGPSGRGMLTDAKKETNHGA